jgi:hypothetical protein
MWLYSYFFSWQKYTMGRKFCYCCCFDRVFLCSRRPQTHNPPASTSWVLVLKICAIIPGLVQEFLSNKSHRDVSFFFLFGRTGIWTQGFTLAKQTVYHLSHISSPFYSGYFGDRISWTICLTLSGNPADLSLPSS